MSCVASCSGFQSLRVECQREPCLAEGAMCTLGRSLSSSTNCADWCCQSRGGYVFFMVLFFCGGTFALCAMYYLHRLHQMNQESGAMLTVENADAQGDTAGMKGAEEASGTAESGPHGGRTKRQVKVNPALLQSLNNVAPT